MKYFTNFEDARKAMNEEGKEGMAIYSVFDHRNIWMSDDTDGHYEAIDSLEYALCEENEREAMENSAWHSNWESHDDSCRRVSLMEEF